MKQLACVTKDQRDYITSAMEACKKYMKSQKALDEEEIYVGFHVTLC